VVRREADDLGRVSRRGPTRRGGFAKACKPAGGWYGLDLFAGTGLNWSLTREQEIDGSPVIVLKAGDPKAIEVIVAENDSRAFPVLRSRLTPYGARAVPFEADANEVIDQMFARVPVRAPAFAFLDPEGSELDWRTVVSIADHKRGHSPYKIEQLILFPTDMGFVRLAPDHPEKVTRIFGHDEWRAIYDKRRRGAIDADSGFEARRSPLESPANRAYRSFFGSWRTRSAKPVRK
jgi:three-Cys-motif partner protein